MAWKIEMKRSILIDLGLVANVRIQVLPSAWRLFYGTLAADEDHLLAMLGIKKNRKQRRHWRGKPHAKLRKDFEEGTWKFSMHSFWRLLLWENPKWLWMLYWPASIDFLTRVEFFHVWLTEVCILILFIALCCSVPIESISWEVAQCVVLWSYS